tara:strand:- start:928 stop:1038 length:111 start_codon:yes stop_codon:yes gene_type:complete
MLKYLSDTIISVKLALKASRLASNGHIEEAKALMLK